jgi:sialidase-1
VTRSHVLFSDDHGATWHIGGSEDEKTNQSTVVERADGSLLQNMRSYHGKHRRAVATSLDGGASWSPVHLDPALIEPVCQASILRCTWPENGAPSRILFSNPASMKRENLTVRLSYDEGSTWPKSKVLHTGPAAYSNLLMLPGGEVACLYESGDHHPYEQITFASFPVSWVESSAPSSR